MQNRPGFIQAMYYVEDEESRAGHIIGWVLYPFWVVVMILVVTTDLFEAGAVSDCHRPVCQSR